eukprot:497581_1
MYTDYGNVAKWLFGDGTAILYHKYILYDKKKVNEKSKGIMAKETCDKGKRTHGIYDTCKEIYDMGKVTHAKELNVLKEVHQEDFHVIKQEKQELIYDKREAVKRRKGNYDQEKGTRVGIF